MNHIQEEPNFSPASFPVILNRLIREDKIKKEGDLLFPSDSYKPAFCPAPTEGARALFVNLRAKLPFADICVWHTSSILHLMHDIPNFNFTIIGAERQAMEAVSNMAENMTQSLVLRDSEKDVISRLAPGRDLMVIAPLVSQAPTVSIDDVNCPSIEKILVDILCDNALLALTGSEAFDIYGAALDRYAVNLKTLLRYASRRNRVEEVKAILKEIKL